MDNSKEIRKLVATFTSGNEKREVEIQDVKDGKAFVQPTTFEPWKDEAIYYHGWETSVENLSAVHALRVDGTREYLGDPPINKRPIYLVAETEMNVP